MEQLHTEHSSPYTAVSGVRIWLYPWATTEFGVAAAGENDQKAGRNCVTGVSKALLLSFSHILTVPYFILRVSKQQNHY